MKKRLAVLALAGLLLVGAAAGGHWWWRVGRFVETTDDAYVQADITLVAPKVEGYLRELRVEQNQSVAAGDVLAVIDDRDYRARRAQAEAARDSDRAALATVESRLAWQHAAIDQARASVAAAEADRARAARDHERYRSLLREDFASRQRYETAEAEARKTEAALVKARAALVAEERQQRVLEAQRGEAVAKLEASEAALALARHNLEDTVIRAPIAGVAGNRAVQQGQYVKIGQQLLAIVPLPQVYVTANFKETQLARIRPGQRVTLAVDAFDGVTIEGKVESFSPATGAQFSLLPPENATGNFTKIVQRVPVRIAIAPEGPLAALLRPGLSVVASVDTRPAEGGAVVAAAYAKAR
jgi:membrane fusion protein (multidrug efflux system)